LLTQNIFEADLLFRACHEGDSPIAIIALIVFLKLAVVVPLVMYLWMNRSGGWLVFWDGLVICTVFFLAIPILWEVRIMIWGFH